MNALPEGITTASVHMDAPLSFIGDPGRLHVEIESSASLIWTATGTPITTFNLTMELAEGQELRVDLPHTDQDGFQDEVGNTYKNWYYTARVTYEREGQLIVYPERDFQIQAGQLEIDLALVPAGTAAPVPQSAPILPVTSIEGLTGEVTFVELGLDRVNNTADVDKPVSIATQAALDTKAPINNPTFTGTVGGITKSMVGLGAVDNTADTAKPVSIAQQAALDGKSNVGHTHAIADTTGLQAALDGKANTVHGHTYADISGTVPTSALPPLAINDVFVVASQAAMLALTAQRGDMAIRTDSGRTFVLATDSPATLADWKEVTAAGQVTSVAGRTGAVVLAKADVGLGSVDNTADTAKPVSTAQQAALDAKVSTSTKGAANGVASLDAGAQVPFAQLPMFRSRNTVTVTSSAGGTLAITFPAGLFDTPPLVQVSKQDGALAKYIPYAASVTKDGCTIGVYAGDGTAASGSTVLAVTAVSMD